MITNRALIERVKRIYYEKNVTQSNKLLYNRQIFDKLISSRNRVIAQEASRNNVISDWCYQSINVILTNGNEGFDESSYAIPVRESLLSIPEIVTEANRPLIKLVGDVAGRNTFYRTTWDQKKNIIGNKYTHRKVFYYIHNNYLYILNNTNLTNVVVTAIFADPTIEDSTTPILDRRFIADARMLDSIVALTIEELSGKKIPQSQQQDQTA
jgi:hypothetical protein